MGGFFLGVLLVIYVFVCLFLIFVILIQSGKGGGLSSLGSASQGLSDALGATGAEKTLNRMTTYCAVGFMVLAILISIISGHMAGESDVIIGDTPVPTEQSLPVAGGGATAPGVPADTGLGAAPGQAIELEAPGGAAPVMPMPSELNTAPAVESAPAEAVESEPVPAAPAETAPGGGNDD